MNGFFRLTGMVLFTMLFFVAGGCKKDEDSTSKPTKPSGTYNPTPYTVKLPAHFPNFVTPKDNPTTLEGISLGKRIYYDEMLSVGGPLEGNACASCHLHSNNFSNNAAGLAVMPHTNLQWTSHFLWNGKVEGSLEDVMNFEIMDFFQADISLFAADSIYRSMSFEAFGNPNITEKEMAKALAQWLRSLVSANSKFDRFFNFEEDLTPLEKRGYLLFNTEQGDCFHCHSTPLTTDLLFHNIGLDSLPVGLDAGRYNVTLNPADLGKFKTPSLRNVEMTAPYMHDGRYQTLEEVVEHYNSKVLHSASLDPIMTKPGKEYGLNLSEYDKAALVAFLKTFTDEEYLNNSELDSPFEN